MTASQNFAIRHKVLGVYLRRRRQAAKLTQAELAVLARTTQPVVSRLEKCVRCPSPGTLERIDRALKDVCR